MQQLGLNDIARMEINNVEKLMEYEVYIFILFTYSVCWFFVALCRLDNLFVLWSTWSISAAIIVKWHLVLCKKITNKISQTEKLLVIFSRSLSKFYFLGLFEVRIS